MTASHHHRCFQIASSEMTFLWFHDSAGSVDPTPIGASSSISYDVFSDARLGHGAKGLEDDVPVPLEALSIVAVELCYSACT